MFEKLFFFIIVPIRVFIETSDGGGKFFCESKNLIDRIGFCNQTVCITCT